MLHRDEFARLDNYKASSSSYTFCNKAFEKILKAKEELEIKLAEEPLNRLKEKEKYEKQVADFYKQTGINFLPETEENLKVWFDGNIKDAAIEYGVNLKDTKKLTKEILDLIDWQRDYNLSFDRFDEKRKHSTLFDIVALGEVSKLIRGVTFAKNEQQQYESESTIRIATTRASQENGIVEDALYFIPKDLVNDEEKYLRSGDILISTANSLNLLGRVTYIPKLNYQCSFGAFMTLIRPDVEKVLPTYLLNCLRSVFAIEYFISNARTTTSISNLPFEVLNSFQLPIPPKEIQQQLVTEIEQYQKVIDGCNLLSKSYAPTFKIQDDWEPFRMSAVAVFVRGPFGGSLKKEIFVEKGYKVYEQSHAIQNDFSIGRYCITKEKFEEMKRFEVLPNDILMSCSGTFGKVALVPENIEKGIINQALLKITPKQDIVRPLFLKLLMETPSFQIQLSKGVSGVAIKNVASVDDIKRFEIKVPDLNTQDILIEEYKEEQRTVNGAIALANKMQDEIKIVIDKVWGK